MNKKIFAGLTALVLSIGFVLTGCESPTAGEAGGRGPGGDAGINSPNLVSKEAGLRDALADGYTQIYVVGDVTLGANLTIPAGTTLVVTTTGDIAARSAGEGTGKLTVGANATLLVNGNLTVDAGRTFALADATAGIILDDAAVVTIGEGAAFTIPEGAVVAADKAVITGAGKTEAIAKELADAKAASPVQYTATQGSLAGLFANAKVETVIYGGGDAVGALTQTGKDLVLTNASLETNDTDPISVRNLTINEGVTLTFGAASLTIAGTLTNNGTIVSASESGGAIVLGTAGVLANNGTITISHAGGTITGTAAQTNAGIIDITGVSSADPFGGITGHLTNNGTIKTAATAAAVQDAILKLAGTGTVEILGTGVGAVGTSGNTTLPLTQNVVIGTGGKLIAPVATAPFSGTGTITITDTGLLDFGVATATSIGATVVNNGTAAGAITTAAATTTVLEVILAIGGKITATSSSLTAITTPSFTVPGNAELATTTGVTLAGGSFPVTVNGIWNAHADLTLAAATALTIGEDAELHASGLTLAGVVTADGISIADGGVLDLGAGTALAVGAQGTITSAGTGKIVVTTKQNLANALLKATATGQNKLTVEVGTIADVATGSTILASTTVVIPNTKTLTLSGVAEGILTNNGAIVVEDGGTLAVTGGTGGGGGGVSTITGSGTITVDAAAASGGHGGGTLTVTGGAGQAGSAGTAVGFAASVTAVNIAVNGTLTILGGNGGAGDSGTGAGGIGGAATVTASTAFTGSGAITVTGGDGNDSDTNSGGNGGNGVLILPVSVTASAGADGSTGSGNEGSGGSTYASGKITVTGSTVDIAVTGGSGGDAASNGTAAAPGVPPAVQATSSPTTFTGTGGAGAATAAAGVGGLPTIAGI